MKRSDIRSILIVEEDNLDELFDIMNEKGIRISKIKDFEYLFTAELIYNMTRELIEQGFNDLKEVTEYVEDKEVLIFLSDCYYDIFEKTDIFFIDLKKISV